MKALPPGTILQLMYLGERLKLIPPGRFLEVGAGAGDVANLLLETGWSGVAYELDIETACRLKVRFKDEIEQGRLTVIHGNILDEKGSHEMDLVISSMVMEHLSDEDEIHFMDVAQSHLVSNGMLIGLVPGSPAHWGIEDEIAGHMRRYTRERIAQLATRTGWIVEHMAGLNFPLSNVLLPLSNRLIKRAESGKLTLSLKDRTLASGKRSIKYKASVPVLFWPIFNRISMYPFHRLQKVFLSSKRALILYFELIRD